MSPSLAPQIAAAVTVLVLALVSLATTCNAGERLRDYVTRLLQDGHVRTRGQRWRFVLLHTVAFPRRTATLPLQLRRARHVHRLT